MYIYGRKSLHVVDALHRLQAVTCTMILLHFLGGTDVAFLHVHARGLFIRRISLFTRGALSLRQCVSAWLFTLAEHEKVENV